MSRIRAHDSFVIQFEEWNRRNSLGNEWRYIKDMTMDSRHSVLNTSIQSFRLKWVPDDSYSMLVNFPFIYAVKVSTDPRLNSLNVLRSHRIHFFVTLKGFSFGERNHSFIKEFLINIDSTTGKSYGGAHQRKPL